MESVVVGRYVIREPSAHGSYGRRTRPPLSSRDPEYFARSLHVTAVSSSAAAGDSSRPAAWPRTQPRTIENKTSIQITELVTSGQRYKLARLQVEFRTKKTLRSVMRHHIRSGNESPGKYLEILEVRL
jgi:hypothetical protein